MSAAEAALTTDELTSLVERFETQKIPHAEWTHFAHLRVGAWQVFHHGREEALVRMRNGIRKLNESHGTPNSETRGYHETITVAYVAVLSDFLAHCAADDPIDVRIARLLDSWVGQRDALLRYYSRDLLLSSRARLSFVAPDLAPLP